MRATLEFDLPEEREEFHMAVKAGALAAAIEEIRTQVFRPARKHGYADGTISDIIKRIPNDDGNTLISELEELFNEILSNNDIDGW